MEEILKEFEHATESEKIQLKIKLEAFLKGFKSTLETKIKNANRVFIVPHCHIDFDAIGAAVGMFEICRHFGVEAAIIIDDNLMAMNAGIRSVYDPILEKYIVLTSNQVEEYRTENDLLIAVDVNKKNLIPKAIENQLDTFPEFVILDHHKTDQLTMKSSARHIDYTTSSTCEMMARLFKFYGIALNASLAKCFLAGIFLDTDKLHKNTDSKTLEIAAKLMSMGVSIQDVNDLFVEDFENDRKVQHLIDGTIFIPFSIHNTAIICNKEHPDTIYTQAELAQAADYLLKYKVDAAYAIGKLSDSEIGISARTTGGMDIARVMRYFMGGGNEHSAAARISNTDDVRLIENELLKLVCREDFYTVKGVLLTGKVPNLKARFVPESPVTVEKKKVLN